MPTKPALLAAAALFTLASPAAFAAPIIGTPLTAGTSDEVLTGNEYIAAGFTMTGSYDLTGVTLRIAATSGTPLLQLFGGGTGGPSGTALATFSGMPGTTSDAYAFTASPLLLQAGTTYWLSLSLTDPAFDDAVSWTIGDTAPTGAGATNAGYLVGFGDLSGPTYPVTQNVEYRIDGIAAGAAVPEPATWAMMLLGLGMAGYALRRRSVGFATVAALA